MEKKELRDTCLQLIQAYKEAKLGYMKMPEDEHPDFSQIKKEIQLAYFSLPMALNYQRNSYTLWESALKTYNDLETRIVFDVTQVSDISEEILRKYLTKYKLALQPNKHIDTRKKISMTVQKNRGGFEYMIQSSNNDFLLLKDAIQITYKKGFPYLSGPKIFHYRSYVIQNYGNIKLENSLYIDIAPDTHVTQSSVKLGIISENQATSLSKEELSLIWRTLLDGSGINPIDMHSPLRFWSRNNFIYTIS